MFWKPANAFQKSIEFSCTMINIYYNTTKSKYMIDTLLARKPRSTYRIFSKEKSIIWISHHRSGPQPPDLLPLDYILKPLN